MARSARLSSRVDLTLFGACVLLALVATVLPERMRAPVSSALRRSVVAPLVQLQHGAERWRSAWVNADRLTLQRDSLAQQAFSVTGLETENERLRRLLGLGARVRWGFVPAEALHVGRGAEKFTLTLTAGSNAGVRRGSPVVAPEGIVGMVQTVDPTMSLAITYQHSEFRVSAMSADGRVFGIVAPHLEGDDGVESGAREDGREDTERLDRYMLELRGVPYRDTLKAGTMIFSTGIAGVYPRGIPIGSVLREVRTAEGWARTYLLRPAVNPGTVSSVMIMSLQRSSEDFNGIWARGGGDSALAGVVIAGDSIARQEALAEAAAQRAALDSTLRFKLDSIRQLDSLRTDSTRFLPVPGQVPGALPPGAGTTQPQRPAPVRPRPAPTPTTPRTTTPTPPAETLRVTPVPEPAPPPPDTLRPEAP